MTGQKLFTTREVAQFLSINEKMVYTLVSEKGLPATKVTGKWLFPRDLVERWIELNTLNHPGLPGPLPPYDGLLIICGSNDILLDRAISLFNRLHDSHVAVFGNLGSLGGIRCLKRNLCHIASSHLLQANGEEYNFPFAREELGQVPAIVNFCRREQGLILPRGNPRNIEGVKDLAKPEVRIINRPVGTGTRLLLDNELAKAGIEGDKIAGYRHEMERHIDVGLEILAGRADAAPGIRAVAGLLELDFLPIRWERFDLLIPKDRFFDPGVQMFLGLLHEKAFKELAGGLLGYGLDHSGKMVFPQAIPAAADAA